MNKALGQVLRLQDFDRDLLRPSSKIYSEDELSTLAAYTNAAQEEVIEKTLSHCSGNKASAARSLGISSGQALIAALFEYSQRPGQAGVADF